MTEHQREESFDASGMPASSEPIDRGRPSRHEEPEPMEPDAAPRDPDGGGSAAPLFSEQDADEYRSRWDSIQTGFVDEPRSSVEEADQLVAQVVDRVTETFAEERQHLEEQWSRGDDVSTEDLRIALKRYHTFFDRLLEL